MIGERLHTPTRAKLRCALPGFDQSRWTKKISGGPNMGRMKLTQYDKCGESNEDGCPGSWYRCSYIYSLVKYQRTRSGDGALSENPNLTRCHDPRVIAAILFLERERVACSNHLDEYRFGH